VDGYDVAQVCRNGHDITSMAESSPQLRKPFCPTCGSQTIMACEHCATAIQGYYHESGILDGVGYTQPAYCFNCGSPFPWTASRARLAVARDLADEAEGLSTEDRERLKDSLDDISRDSASIHAATSRIRRIAATVRGPTGAALHELVTEIAAETARKTLLGGP
jgi:hypothetical protein